MIASTLTFLIAVIAAVAAVPQTICVGVEGSATYQYRANLTTTSPSYSFYSGLYDFRPAVNESGAVTVAVMAKFIAYHVPVVTLTVFYARPYAWHGVRIFQFPVDTPSAGMTWMSLVNDTQPLTFFDQRPVPMSFC